MSSPDKYLPWSYVDTFTAQQIAGLVADVDVAHRGVTKFYAAVAPILERIQTDHLRACASFVRKYRKAEDGSITRTDPSNDLQPGCLPCDWILEALNSPVPSPEVFESDFMWTQKHYRHQKYNRNTIAKWLIEADLKSHYDFQTGESTSKPSGTHRNSATRKNLAPDYQAEFDKIKGPKARGEYLLKLFKKLNTYVAVANAVGRERQYVTPLIKMAQTQASDKFQNNVMRLNSR